MVACSSHQLWQCCEVLLEGRAHARLLWTGTWTVVREGLSETGHSPLLLPVFLEEI